MYLSLLELSWLNIGYGKTNNKTTDYNFADHPVSEITPLRANRTTGTSNCLDSVINIKTLNQKTQSFCSKFDLLIRASINKVVVNGLIKRISEHKINHKG